MTSPLLVLHAVITTPSFLCAHSEPAPTHASIDCQTDPKHSLEPQVCNFSSFYFKYMGTGNVLCDVIVLKILQVHVGIELH